MAACTAISAFLPSVVSKSIFAPRRADKSIEAESAPASIMNAGVAAVQVVKLGEGVVAIANDTKAISTKKVPVINGNVSELAKTTSIFNDINKGVNTLTKHVSINDMIGLATLANALSKDDKETALIEGGCGYAGMLAFEGAHKMLFGTSSASRENGVNKIESKEGLLFKNSSSFRRKAKTVNLYCEQQAEALKDSGAVKKFIGKMFKCAPSAVKGLSFAGFSIGGSALCYNYIGTPLAKVVTGREAA